MRFGYLILCSAIAAGVCAAQQPNHLFFRVTMDASVSHAASGRLLIFLQPGTGAKSVDISEFEPRNVWVAAKEVHDLARGASVDIDTDDQAFPSGFSSLKPGDYQAQAVLDVHHSYNYGGRAGGDIESEVVPLPHFTPGSPGEPVFHLTIVEPERHGKPRALSEAEEKSYQASAHPEDFVSPSLSKFWGRPIDVRAIVLLPPGYGAHPAQRYPAIYFTHGFGGKLEYLEGKARQASADMQRKTIPEMIWILLDESFSSGTHEFADSANNGPWGQALTREFIPYIESKYRLDRRAAGRFLNGHSSGGWATLWLQVNYPKMFGGTWSTSPDSSDFHDFTGPDLYAAHANVYRRPDGTPYPLIRDKGKVLATFEDFARLEPVLGPYGGQIASFEWVFSPRGPGGAPMPMFDRATGDVYPDVVQAWQKYDIAHLLATHWSTLAPDLNGKIHVIVGTADTFYLDGAAHKLDAVLKSLHAKAQVTFVEGKTHMDLYQIGDNRSGLLDQIVKEMYASWQRSRSRP